MGQKKTKLDECREILRQNAIADLAKIAKVDEVDYDTDIPEDKRERFRRNLTHRWIWWETDIGLPLVLSLNAHEEQLKENLDDMEFVCEADANFMVADLDKIIEERKGTWLYK